jgi:DnaA family protein
MKQIALPITVDVEQTLQNYVVGSNQAVVDHFKLFASHPNRSPVPTYIWGGSGSGKTHLLRAVVHELNTLKQPFGWLDSTHAKHKPQVFDAAGDVILMDDVEQFSPSEQQFAFNCFVNALTPTAGLQRWVVASGSLPPQDLKLREDLRTRLGWGHVFHLQTLSEQGCREVLKRHSTELGISLPVELEDYILSRFSRDLSTLIRLLKELDAFALQSKRPATIPLLKAMLDES